MKNLKTFDDFLIESAGKQAAISVGTEMLKKKLAEAADEISQHAMKVDGDESDLTFSDALKEAMFENAAILKKVAMNVAAKKANEGVFPNLAKRSGASTAVAKATGMPKGKGIDAKESLNVMPVKEMCGKVHEMAVMHDSDDEESHTYEGYLKECADMINAMKKVGISESNLNEAKVDNEEEFKKYGQSVLKKAFGDKYDEDKANDVIDGISKKVDGDWGAAIGILQSSLG